MTSIVDKLPKICYNQQITHAPKTTLDITASEDPNLHSTSDGIVFSPYAHGVYGSHDNGVVHALSCSAEAASAGANALCGNDQ